MRLRDHAFTPSLLALAFAAAFTAAPRAAHADEAACFAASEQEISLHKDKKYGQALEQLVICSASSCPAEVRDECGRRIVALNAAMPTVVLAATDAAGNDLVGVTVSIDGTAMPDALDGRGRPLDPGNHTIHFEAAGKPPVDKTIVAREGEKDRRVTAILGPTSAALPLPGPVVPPPLAPPPEPTHASSWNNQKTLAVVAGGVGVVGIVMGAGFGAAAISDWSTEQNDCKSSKVCTDPAGATSAHSSAETAGAVSTAAFIVGGVGVAAGVVLWIKAPHGSAEKTPPAALGSLRLEPMLGPKAQGMLLGGRF